jgi:DNA-binding XRE family transcriptional regulator
MTQVKKMIASASRDPKDYIPLEVAERIWDGVNPVRAWREYRALTQDLLATTVGLTRAFLSQIETGKREMLVSSLQKLAAALDTDLSFLLLAREGNKA